MRTVLAIDGADNCGYDCHLASEELFARIFPGPGRDVELIEDLLEREPEGALDTEFEAMWLRRVPKKRCAASTASCSMS